jgi:7,8-dihydroneopterin aldolase/epimerase/oxygenase
MDDRILLRSIEFYGYHGVPAAERRIGHRFSVDVALPLDLAGAGRSDALDATVDYGDLCRRVLEVGQGPSVRLIETLAERIAAACLEAYPAVAAVQVTIRKLLPPLPATVAAAEVEIHRQRDPGR